jgi:hypothetical protein
MESWQTHMRFDPVSAFLSSKYEALNYFVRRDLLDEDVGLVHPMWQLPEAQKIFKKQQTDGSWDRSVGMKKHKDINYGLIETWKQIRYLVEKFGFNRKDPSTERAAEFLFSCQTEVGDRRGFLANQYATY